MTNVILVMLGAFITNAAVSLSSSNKGASVGEKRRYPLLTFAWSKQRLGAFPAWNSAFPVRATVTLAVQRPIGAHVALIAMYAWYWFVLPLVITVNLMAAYELQLTGFWLAIGRNMTTGVLVVSGVLYVKRFGHLIADTSRIRSISLGKRCVMGMMFGFGTVLLLVVGFAVVEVILGALVDFDFRNASSELKALQFADSGGALGVFSIVVLGPLAEEILHRQIITANLAKRWGWPIGILVGAVIFALSHGNAFSAVGVLPIGLLLGYVYFRTRSVVTCFLAHATINAVACMTWAWG